MTFEDIELDWCDIDGIITFLEEYPNAFEQHLSDFGRLDPKSDASHILEQLNAMAEVAT